MPLPKIPKDFNLIVDGRSYHGRVVSFDPPDLTLMTEEIRNAGDQFGYDVDLGMEKLTCSFVLDEYDPDLMSLYGLTSSPSPVQLTFRSSLENEEVAEPHQIEILGKITGISRDTFQNNQRNQATFNVTCRTYKETINGRVVFDLAQNKRVVDGVDQLAVRMTNLGLFS